MSMVDGVVLLVDAYEGVMSQTKFVLSKAIAANRKPIVVLNKIDRDMHRADEVEHEILDLFLGLTSNEDLLEYPLLYAAGRQGWVCKSLADVPGTQGVIPLLDAIIKSIPQPKIHENQSFTMAVNTIQTDNHLGRIVTGKVESGMISIGDKIKVISLDGKTISNESKVTKLFYLQGLQRVDVDTAYAGEIISLAGCEGGVSETICALEINEPLQSIPLSPPVISMTFGPNDSPLGGKEGTYV